MYGVSTTSTVRRPAKDFLRTLFASISMLTVALAISFNSIAAGQASTLPNGVACGDVKQDSAVLWAHSTAIGSAAFEYSASPAAYKGQTNGIVLGCINRREIKARQCG